MQIKTKLYAQESLCKNFYWRNWDIQVITSKASKNKRNKVKGKISSTSLPSTICNIRWRKWSQWSRQVQKADKACGHDSWAAQPLAKWKLRSKEGRAFTCCVVAVCILWSACVWLSVCVLWSEGHTSSTERTPQLDREKCVHLCRCSIPWTLRGVWEYQERVN